jgi:hypothetical protein
MTLRERVANFINPEQQRELDELAESVRLLYQAQQEQWINAPTAVDLLEQLREQGHDAGYLYDLITQIEWEEIGTSGSTLRGGERERVAKDSRRQWIYNPLYQWAIWLWTNYGFGQQVSITPMDENAVETWTEFWTADRNDPVLGADNIQQLSIDLLVDGNLFLAYHASDVDGQVTITEVCQEEITEILTHPRNDRMPVFYKRVFKDANLGDQIWYYPDWMARVTGVLDKPFDNSGVTVAEALEVPREKRTDLMATDADTVSGRAFAGTVTVMQFIPWNRKEKKDLLGWPLSSAAGPWLRSHRQFVAHRLTVSAAKAMFVRRKTHKGGSRAQRAIIDTVASNANRYRYLDSNPAAAAGSVEVENAAIKTEDLPMRTGADDAKTDNEIFTWMPSLALGVYPHYMGLGDAYRLATSTSMEKPLEMQWDRFQSFWMAQFRRMVRIVLEFANEFGKKKFETGAVVTMDRLTEIDLDGASAGIGRMFSDVFQPALDAGVMDADTYQALVNFTVTYTLEALGGNDLAEQIQLDQAKKKEEEPKTETQEPQAEMSATTKMLTEAMANYLDGTVGIDDTVAFLAGVLAEQGE